MQLYKLSEEVRMALAVLEEGPQEGEELNIFLKRVGAKLDDATLALQFEDKIQAVACVHHELTTQAGAVEAEITRLKKRADSYRANAEQLRDYLHQGMEHSGISKVKTPLFTVWVQNCPPSVDVVCQEDVPDEFIVVPPPPPPRVDKAAVLEHFKATGEVAQGCDIICDRRVLRIK